MLFNKGALLFLAAHAAVTLTSGFVAPSSGLAPFGVSHQRCSFVTSVSAESVEAADEPAVEEIPEAEPVVAESESEEAADEPAVEEIPEAEPVVAESESEAVVAEESAEDAPADEGEDAKAPVKKDRLTVFVGNLSFDTTDAEVRDLFAQYGKVELVSVPRDLNTGKSRGFAFVDLNTKEEIDASIEALNDTEFGGRRIRVAESLPKEKLKKGETVENNDGFKKIYVGNIPFETTKDELIEFYSEYGEVKEVYLPTDINSGQPRGFAFVTMDEEHHQSAIDATNGIQYGGRMLAVSEPLPRGKKAPPRVYPQRTKLYVGNLSFYTTLDSVQALFEEYGKVFDCYMPTDRETGASRGFAFVTMDPDSAVAAMDETDGYELDGRIIRVNEAQPKYGDSKPRYSDDEGSYDDEGADGDFEGGGDSYDEGASGGF